MEEISKNIFEGWLRKKNRSSRWNKRWFYIAANQYKLMYSHDKPSATRKKKIAGVEAVNLKNVSSVHPSSGGKSGTTFEFEVVFKSLPGETAESYFLKADDMKSMQEWIAVLTARVLDLPHISKRYSQPWTSNPLQDSRTGSVTVRYGLPSLYISVSPTVGTPKIEKDTYKGCIIALAKVLGNSKLAEIVKSGHFEINKSKENPKQLALQLLDYCCKLNIDYNTDFVTVLKYIHSDVIVPSVSSLRELAAPHAFRAVPGSWKIKYQCNPSGSLLVQHEFCEESCVSEAVYFSFKWQLSLKFSRNNLLTCEDQKLYIIGISSVKDSERTARVGLYSVDKRKFNAIRNKLKPLFSPTLEYSLIYNRSISLLPVHKDLPRLTRGIHIANKSRETLFKGEAGTDSSDVMLLRQCLASLATSLEDSLFSSVATDSFLNEHLPLDISHGAMGSHLEKLWKVEELKESKMFKILKLVNQDMVSPAVIRLRLHLYSKFPYNDVSSSWRVSIQCEGKRIRVCHFKWEQSKSSKHDTFRFRWMLALTIDSQSFEMVGAEVAVIDYSFGSITSDEFRENFHSSIEPFLTNNGMPQTLILRKLDQELRYNCEAEAT